MKKASLKLAASLIAVQPAMLHAQDSITPAAPAAPAADDELFEVPLEDLLIPMRAELDSSRIG